MQDVTNWSEHAGGAVAYAPSPAAAEKLRSAFMARTRSNQPETLVESRMAPRTARNRTIGIATETLTSSRVEPRTIEDRWPASACMTSGMR